MTFSSGTMLVCTVGGSHAPIVTAIRTHQPTFVWFICTEEGKAGSVQQIRGQGNCIKKHPADERPSLPNIPAQVGLIKDQYDVWIVPPDDPDIIHANLRKLFDSLLKKSPRPRIIADYTGGTKSMTAALILAGLEHDGDVELTFVVGQRADLKQVTDGTEIPISANVDRIRFSHKFRVALAPWSYFGFAESRVSLENMRQPRDSNDLRRYLAALAASRAFEAWDKFDHGKAYQLLQPLGSLFGRYLATLALLNSECESQIPAQLLDLYLNMKRRAERSQFDDAVARGYRLIEWTAQWLLRRDAGVDTSNVPGDIIPSEVKLPKNEQGRYFAGLRNAWALLETLGADDAVRTFAHDHGKELLPLLTTRNHSILAHGFQPITQSEWSQWHTWLTSSFYPFLQSETSRIGLNRTPPQLPDAMPEE